MSLGADGMVVGTRAAGSLSEALLAALEQPETAFSLSYRVGVDTQTCQRQLEALVREGEVARHGGDQTAVYVRKGKSARAS